MFNDQCPLQWQIKSGTIENSIMTGKSTLPCRKTRKGNSEFKKNDSFESKTTTKGNIEKWVTLAFFHYSQVQKNIWEMPCLS